MQQLSDEEFYQQLKKEKTVTNITVSPFDPHFRSHIEKGVWSLVSTLLTKNYYPVSSCEGHEKEKLLYITLAFGELFLFRCFLNTLQQSSIKGLEWETFDPQFKTKVVINSSNVDKIPSTIKEEVQYVNKLFGTNYLSYRYVRVMIKSCNKYQKKQLEKLFQSL